MRNWIILLVVVAAGGWLFSQAGKMYRARDDFRERVDHYVGVVDGKNFAAVKQSLVKEAGQRGLELAPNEIRIRYEDEAQRTVAQNLVGDRLGTQFVNKRVTIRCRVVWRLAGFPWSQEIERSRVIQLRATQGGGTGGLEQMIDAAPRF